MHHNTIVGKIFETVFGIHRFTIQTDVAKGFTLWRKLWGRVLPRSLRFFPMDERNYDCTTHLIKYGIFGYLSLSGFFSIHDSITRFLRSCFWISG